uniref:Uncharacterized protein n=1 Tax=Romanomermis culicivorax TaxID=13658 RepID=A0A915HY62_ROMCU
MQSTQRYRTKGKFSFPSVPLGVIVGHFLENCSYPLRSKVDFQAERFKVLAIGSVPFRRKKQVFKDPLEKNTTITDQMLSSTCRKS